MESPSLSILQKSLSNGVPSTPRCHSDTMASMQSTKGVRLPKGGHSALIWERYVAWRTHAREHGVPQIAYYAKTPRIKAIVPFFPMSPFSPPIVAATYGK